MFYYQSDSFRLMSVTTAFIFLLSTNLTTSNKYTPDWNSIDSRPIPSWYNDAKFGIFMHLTTSVVPGKTTFHNFLKMLLYEKIINAIMLNYD